MTDGIGEGKLDRTWEKAWSVVGSDGLDDGSKVKWLLGTCATASDVEPRGRGPVSSPHFDFPVFRAVI